MVEFTYPLEAIDTSRGSDETTINAVLDILGLQPGDEQREILFCRRRKILVAGGERAGKSFTSSLFLVTRAPFGQLFWLVGPDYEQATAEFDYCVEFFSKLGAIRSKQDVSRPKIGKCTIILKTGQVIETKTAAEVQKIAGKAPDGIIMCEAAQHSEMSYMKCVARVGEKRGWLILCGTFEGSANWYANLFHEWALGDNPDHAIAFSLPSWTNRVIYPGGRNDPEILNIERALRRIEGLFEERIAAVPIPPIGLVFREFRKSIHVSDQARYNSRLPVYLAVDPSDGSAPYAVGVYQFLACACGPHTEDRIEQAYCIDELYETGKGVEEIVKIGKRRPWWPKIKGGAIDVEAPDDKKRWLSFGGIPLKAAKIPQLLGIRRAKSFMHYDTDLTTGLVTNQPHVQFNKACEGILHEFTKYKRKDPTDEDMIPADVPPRNQPNHHIKALWYLLVARYGYVRGKRLNGAAHNWKRR